MTFSVEVIRRIYNDENGDYIEITPDPDGLGCVSVKTITLGSIDPTGLTMLAPAEASLVAIAISMCAEDIRVAGNKPRKKS